MYVFKVNKRMIVIFILMLFLCIKYLVTCKEKKIMVNSNLINYCIVIDAGHGMPDGGAVSKEGIQEASLNLEIAEKLRDLLEMNGFDTIMTRKTNNCIASEDKKASIREMKQSDLENRVKIANESKADFMVSIHMNEFSQSKLWGWQTFYSKDSEKGKKLATFIQMGISNCIDRPNKRKSLPIEGIKIINKTNLPVIIVECGFLSNEQDVRLLQTEEYQTKIVEGIVEGIKNYYNSL